MIHSVSEPIDSNLRALGFEDSFKNLAAGRIRKRKTVTVTLGPPDR